jgi:glycosyltransferase involved in cell wall biosynthesis
MNSSKFSAEKIKVLRIIARLNIGGPAIHTILLSSHLEKLGYQTLLVSGQVESDEGDMHYLAEAERVEPVIIPRLGRRLLPLSDLVAFLRILHLLFSWRPHIVHTHTAKAGAVGRTATATYNGVQSFKFKVQSWVQRFSRGRFNNRQVSIINDKCKVVHTFHGHVLEGYFSHFKTRLFRLIERILAKCTDVIVVVSEAQRKELFGKYGIGKSEQYRVIPLGLNLGPFTQATKKRGGLRSGLGLSENGESLVAIVGRLTAIKNHSLFLESVSVLMKEDSDTRARFLIVGDGELREDLEGKAEELAIQDGVIFTGWMQDLGVLYGNLDVLAVTSNNEGTPVALIEAMAAGVPVIATDVGGVRELISDFGFRIAELSEAGFEICERGVLVRKGDVRGFAKGLKYLLEHPEVRTEMGQRGQEYALQNHSMERLVADIDQLYQSLLTKRDK